MEETPSSSSPPKNEETPREILRRKLRNKTQQRSRGSRPMPAGLHSQGLSEVFSMVDQMMKQNPEILKEMEGQVKKMIDNTGGMGEMEKKFKNIVNSGELEKMAQALDEHNGQNPQKNKRKNKKNKNKKTKKPPPVIIQEQATSNNLE